MSSSARVGVSEGLVACSSINFGRPGAQLGSSVAFGSGCGQALPGCCAKRLYVHGGPVQGSAHMPHAPHMLSEIRVRIGEAGPHARRLPFELSLLNTRAQGLFIYLASSYLRGPEVCSSPLHRHLYTMKDNSVLVAIMTKQLKIYTMSATSTPNFNHGSVRKRLLADSVHVGMPPEREVF